MAATFVVEDGTIVADANSYLEVADADQYFENHSNPVAWTGATAPDKQDALRIATQYLDIRYIWKGITADKTQELDWPRSSVIDENDRSVDDDIIPQDVKDATAEAALRHINEVADGSSLIPDQDTPGSIRKTRDKVDVLETEVEYAGAAQQQKAFPLIDHLLRGLIEGPGLRRG